MIGHPVTVSSCFLLIDTTHRHTAKAYPVLAAGRALAKPGCLRDRIRLVKYKMKGAICNIRVSGLCTIFWEVGVRLTGRQETEIGRGGGPHGAKSSEDPWSFGVLQRCCTFG